MLNSIPQPKTITKPKETVKATSANNLGFDFSDLELGVRKPQVKGKGKVKTVLSGDTIIVKGAGGKEKRLVISNISVPRLSTKKDTVDEPFGYHAREFLRARLLDQMVEFTLADNNTTTAGANNNNTPREYANVSINGEDVAALLVQAGLAKVNIPKKVEEEYNALVANTKKGAKKPELDIASLPFEKQELYKLQLEAEKAKVGMFSGVAGVREITYDYNVQDIYNKYKGKTLTAYVDRVLDGSTFRLEIEDAPGSLKHTMVVVSLAGALSARVGGGKDEPASVEGTKALEFSEARLAGRTVQLTLAGVDKNNNIYGSIAVPQGNIAVRLLETRNAKFVPWTAVLTKEASILATAAGVTDMNGDKPVLQGTVTQVLSGDTVIVRDQYTNEHKVTFSAIQVPRQRGGSNGKSEPFAFEAKEFVRKLLIGARVQVTVDYTREGNNTATKDDATTAAPATPEKRIFGTVVKNNNVNIALELLANGLAEVQSYSKDAERPIMYGQYLTAEFTAKQNEKGKWNTKTTAPAQPVDYTNVFSKTDDKNSKNSTSKAQQKAASKELSDAYDKVATKITQSNTHAVVEAVYGATRVKLYVPSQHCYVTVSLAGVNGPPMVKGEKNQFAQEAVAYLKRYLQHEVIIESATKSKTGGLLGNIIDKSTKQSIAIALIEQGLLSVLKFAADRNKHGKDMVSAETKAKTARRGIWVDYDEEKERLAAEKAKAEANAALGVGVFTKEDGAAYIKVLVTDVVDPAHVYINNIADPMIATIKEKLAAFVPSEQRDPEFVPTKGSIVIAKYEEDGQYYRARVDNYKQGNGQCAIQYIDFGAVDQVHIDNIRACPEELSKFKPLAKPARLTGVSSPLDDTEYYTIAINALDKWTHNIEFDARIDSTDHTGVINITLYHPDEEVSVNGHMIKYGLALVDNKIQRRFESIHAQLEEYELEAKDNHRGIWEYGVIDMSKPQDD